MGKLIIIIAIAIGGYFAYQAYMENQNHSFSMIEESAAGKITNRIMNEDIDAEFKRKTGQTL